MKKAKKRSLKARRSRSGMPSLAERNEEKTRTIRKSRRLAMKKKREKRNRRSTIGEIMQVTPRKGERNLGEASAEQLALEAAAQHDKYLKSARKTTRKIKSKAEGSKGPESNRNREVAGNEQSPWERRRPRRSFWKGTPPDQTVVELFEQSSLELEDEGEVTPMDEDTEPEDWDEEPNSEDRAFLKSKQRRANKRRRLRTHGSGRRQRNWVQTTSGRKARV